MGKFFIGANETIRVQFVDGEWADIKAEFSQADHDYITAAMMKANVPTNGQAEAEISMNFGKAATLERAVVAWSFAEDGKPVPVSPENLSQLRTKYRFLILAEVDRLAREAGAFSKN